MAMQQDPATLDQLRVLLAIVETGSFSGAGRRLHRVQSAVSHAVAAMEEQFGAPLFDRSTRRPTLTPTGESVLILARAVCARADALRELVFAIRRGDEAAVEFAVDVVYPHDALAESCRAFATRWPEVQLRLHTDTLGPVAARVREGACAFGIVGPAADLRGLSAEHLGFARMIPVVAPGHPLAGRRGPIPVEDLAEHVQIVLSERSTPDTTADQAVLSPRTWRVHDLYTKQALLEGGLGWGNLPAALVAQSTAAGRLLRIHAAPWPAEGLSLAMSVVTRPGSPPGPAARWLMGRLRQICEASTNEMKDI